MYNINEICDLQDCVGCRACEQKCPTQAISFIIDKESFLYPQIDDKKCIECGNCIKVCQVCQKEISKKDSLKAYAAVCKDKNILWRAASGGVFGVLADAFVNNGGFVCGCIWNDNMEAIHVLTNEKKIIKQMQGSKYVQSDISEILSQISEKLKAGKRILFAGTPCQVMAVKRYTNNDEKLCTVDLICHGCPSAKDHMQYIEYLEKEVLHGKIVGMNYRNKDNGWSLRLRVDYRKGNRYKYKYIYNNESYYYHTFLEGNNYRKSCYNCQYASPYRQGDITIGDFWGIEAYLPKVDTSGGVSAILVSTRNGEELLESVDRLDLYEIERECVIENNGQLRKPVDLDADKRNSYLRYVHDRDFEKLKEICKIGIAKKIYNRVVGMTPYRFKHFVKMLVRR